MTDQPKSTQLSPEEWKQLCAMNAKQLFDYISNIPSMVKADEVAPITSGLTANHIAEINAHIERGSQFLGAWLRSKPIQLAEQAKMQGIPLTPGERDSLQRASANGAEPPRQKRKYTRKAKSEVATA